ncbi:LysR family transcriptional regulator [Litorilituus lipolyticus]|uniref:LysR family transcriptional regulator n=1 Tax=Litorilituus lipolyticus TaxID=2491017 RepID=A0A502KKL6_9GAMM|nr:LysR family transcriptional regulator [Litorilituus lipolyticus]TPH12112.1 LysR family transcriptional regulator [Litorilituus lipolyticus]
MIKADDIFLFVQVVDEGSFSKVADKLEMTNSVVSKRISRLEQEINVQLFYRTTRKLTLTDAGRALYGKARLAKQALQDAQDTVTGYGDAVRGKIKVTVPVVSAHILLSASIADFCKLYPDVEVELFVSNRMVDIIDDGYDLAIRTADLEDSSLIARRLIDSHWVVCASPSYLENHGTPVHPSELKDHQCLIYKYEGVGPDNWQFQLNGEDCYIQVCGRFHANSLESIKQASLNGFGISYLPKILIHEELAQGKLLSLLSDYSTKRLGIYAVYPRSRQPDKKLNLLVEHLREAFLNRKGHFY